MWLALASYVLALTVIVLSWFVVAFVYLVTVPFDRNRLIVGRTARLCAVAASKCYPKWRWRVEGPFPNMRGRPHVVVANHESMLDTFLLSYLPWEMKWIAKAEAFKMPFVGQIIAMAGDIPVVRGDSESGTAALEKARQYLKRGMSVMVFPEGTRSRDGQLLPFKVGAFKLAIETGCPVLPIAVNGSGQGMPADGPWIRPADIVARVLEPISTQGLRLEDVEALRDRVRERVSAAREELRAPARQPVVADVLSPLAD